MSRLEEAMARFDKALERLERAATNLRDRAPLDEEGGEALSAQRERTEAMAARLDDAIGELKDVLGSR